MTTQNSAAKFKDALNIVISGTVEQLKELVDAGLDLNFMSGSITLLSMAVICNRLDMMDYLILNGVDINAVSPEHGTSLILAITKDRTEAAKKIMLAGADFTKYRDTLLELAGERKNYEVFKFIHRMEQPVNKFPISVSHPLEIKCVDGDEIKKKVFYGDDENINISFSKLIAICNALVGRVKLIELKEPIDLKDFRVEQFSINEFLANKDASAESSIFEGYNYTKIQQQFIKECTTGQCGKFLNDESLNYNYKVAYEYFANNCMSGKCGEYMSHIVDHSI